MRSALIYGVTLLLLNSLSYSAGFIESLNQLIERHPRVLSVEADHDASFSKMREIHKRQFGLNMDFRIGQSYQRYKKPLLPFTERDMKENSFKVTKLLYDFGKSDGQVEDARFTAEQSGVAIESVKQGLILEAITANVSYQRSLKILAYAQKSEENIKKQTQLESIMVKKGKGYSSNVLQAKTSLAGAQSRRVRAQGSVSIAKARLQAVFRSLYSDLTYNESFNIDLEILPPTLEKAKEIALSNNRQIQVGAMRSSALDQRVKSAFAKEYRPKVQFVGDIGRNFDKDGNNGLQEDAKAMVEVVFAFNGSNAGKYAIQAVKNEAASSKLRERETKDLVVEQVAIAWQNLATAKTNSLYIENQMNISQQFLELARVEHKNGRRNLLDVLSAETTKINAESDFASVHYDIVIASFTLLQAMGKLDMALVEKTLF